MQTTQGTYAIVGIKSITLDTDIGMLKTRMEQVLVLQPGAITSYRVANLIQFYAVTISKLLRKNAALSKVLCE